MKMYHSEISARFFFVSASLCFVQIVLENALKGYNVAIYFVAFVMSFGLIVRLYNLTI